MTIFQALILGIVQGLTEFLPVSSSGHLVIMEQVLGIHIAPEDMQAMNVLLHGGTLAALLIVYAETWKRILLSLFTKDHHSQKLLIALIVATVPGAVIGFLFEDQIAEIFSDPSLVAIAFLGTALALILGESLSEKRGIFQAFLHHHDGVPRLGAALFVGIAQACALLPGLSRSGLTISAGRLAGLSRKESLDFSFLMLGPILGGALTLTLVHLIQGEIVLPALPITLTGVLSAFAVSTLSMVFLRSFVVRHSLSWFVPYLVGISLLILL